MHPSRRPASVLVVVVALAVQVAHGVPARASRGVGAVRCCSSTCHHGRPAPAAPRCCVRDLGSDEFTVSPPARAPEVSPVVHAAPGDVPAVPAVATATLHRAAPLARARGVPVRLLTGSLRI